MRGISACYFLCILFSYSVCYAQLSRAELESRKRESHRRIAETERILDQVQSKREVSLGQLSALNSQMTSLEQLLSTLVAEVSYVSTEIGEVSRVALSLGEDLERLREEYARMIVWAYTHRMGLQQLVFLFSSKSFQQLYLRMRYLARFCGAKADSIGGNREGKGVVRGSAKDVKCEAGLSAKIIESAAFAQGQIIGFAGREAGFGFAVRQKDEAITSGFTYESRGVEAFEHFDCEFGKNGVFEAFFASRRCTSVDSFFSFESEADCLAGAGFCGRAIWQAKSSGAEARDS